MIESVVDFYDGLAADYHLLYGDEWDAAVRRQGSALARLIREVHGDRRVSVLDCSCGIGTQAIGLALEGHRVHATDISERSVERARRESTRLGADVSFDVADVRDLSLVEGTYDVVISCDNALPHLLEDDDLERALRAMCSKTHPDGLLIVTIRDYDKLLLDRTTVGPPLVVGGSPRRIVLRLHEWDEAGPGYNVRLIVLTECVDGWKAVEHATRYRAITRSELARAAMRAGASSATWRGDEIVRGQPVMIARVAPATKEHVRVHGR